VISRILLALEASGAVIRSPIEEDRHGFGWPAADRIAAEADAAIVRAATRRAVEFIAAQRTMLPAYLADLARDAEARTKATTRALRSLRAQWDSDRFVVDGARVAVIGPANAGKSTLVNQLAGAEHVLAFPEAGTTRDWVSLDTAIEGVPITLIDTAGQMGDPDPLAAEAVQRGREQSVRADLIILVLDGSRPMASDSLSRLIDSAGVGRLVVAVNKRDLAPAWDSGRRTVGSGAAWVSLSALSGQRVDVLRRAIVCGLGVDQCRSDQPRLFTARQAGIVSRAIETRPTAPAIVASIGLLLGRTPDLTSGPR
jgi:tRNA modification GTPase